MKHLICLMVTSLFSAGFLFVAELKASSDSDPITVVSKKSLKDSALTVETDPQSADESINRISGDYDRGYSSSEYSFKSPDHYKPGPFGRQ